MFRNPRHGRRKGSAWAGCQVMMTEDGNAMDPRLAELGQTDQEEQDCGEAPPRSTLTFAGIKIISSWQWNQTSVRRVHNPTYSLIQTGMNQWGRSCVYIFHDEGSVSPLTTPRFPHHPQLKIRASKNWQLRFSANTNSECPQCLLFARQFSIYFRCIDSFNPHNNPMS